MPTLTNYRGLQIVDSTLTGDGGAAIQDDLISLVNWGPKSVWQQTTSPGTGDNQSSDFYPGSLWQQTSPSNQLFICVASTTTSATWVPVLLALVQDTSPKLGGNLDVNSHKLVGAVDIGASSADTLTLTSANITTPSGVLFTKTAQSGVQEFLQGWRVSDDSSSSLSITNGTSSDGTFAPKFQGVQGGANVALNFNGQGTTNSGTSPIILFLGQLGGSEVPKDSTRPVVAFWNQLTPIMQLTGGYNVQLKGPELTPELAGIARDTVSLAPVDKASDDRRLYIQSETGAPVSIGNGTIGSTGPVGIQPQNLDNGQLLAFDSVTELVTIAAAATTDTGFNLPANAVVLGVSVRVTTAIPTATTFTVTGATSGTVFNTTAVSVAADSTDPGTKAGAFFNSAAQHVRITPNATPAGSTGKVRITAHFYTITPPTS